jgi:hypothetical protein
MSVPFEAGRGVPQGSSTRRDRFRSSEVIGGGFGAASSLRAQLTSHSVHAVMDRVNNLLCIKINTYLPKFQGRFYHF